MSTASKTLPAVFRKTATRTDSNDSPESPSSPSQTEKPTMLKDLKDQMKKFPFDLSALSSVADAIRHKESIDDRKFLLEHALTWTSRLENGPISHKIQDKIVELLYNDLGHPPATSIGNAYAWRTADGSYNNIEIPNLGKAGTPYARSVQQSHPIPADRLPDPGLIFDTLLKREGFVKHPAGLSSLMFSFAALVIHTVFRTSHTDVNINETSSYVDLSPLYGHNQEAQDQVRVRDGHGLLHPDVFAEDRLLLLPPAVCVLLVLFNRNHNYIAKRLLEINERGDFVNPATLKTDNPVDKAKLIAQEEELFQIARLINCNWFGSIIFSDYFSCILGLVRDGSSWSLNPFNEIRNEDHSVFERGKGNVCSVEFNCLYRWHATTSVEDEKWVDEQFNHIFEGKTPEEVTREDFKGAARKIAASLPDVTHWTFGRLQRQSDGTFKDDDLANVLKNATDHPAAAFRARGTPASMRLHEIMGIDQNRRWGVCSLNDFRSYLGLKRYKSFREWNPDPEIADAAEKLYGHIENLELYVGLQAEEAKPVMEGAGLCPGFTLSRAILSDAIALTRGDRFFTQDNTPFNLTAWGFADCQRDPNAFGFGSTLGKLILRTLPNHYTENSVYTFFPLMTPESMKKSLTKLKVIDQYDLSRPIGRVGVKKVADYGLVRDVLNNKNSFYKLYASRVAKVIPGKGFYAVEPEILEKVHKALVDSPASLDKITTFFYESTRELISASSFTLVGKKTFGVDIVRDVLKVVPVIWAASAIAGIPLKTSNSPQGRYTPSELYNILGDIYSYIFLDNEASRVMVLQAKVLADVKVLLGQIKDHLHDDKKQSVARVVGSVFSKQKKAEQSDLAKRLVALGGTSDEVANTILALMVATTELSLALTNVVNICFDSEHQATILNSIKSGEGKTSLDGFIREALRLDPSFAGVYRTASKDQTIGNLSFKNGDKVFLDLAAANKEESAFPSPLKINTARDSKSSLHGDGLFCHFGEQLTTKIIGRVLEAIYTFDKIRRAPGRSGVLPRFRSTSHLQLHYAYLDASQLCSPWPTSLTLLYDATPSQSKDGVN